ncbi:beta-lactamase family protein [Streptomyces sp. NBC_00101]
MSSTSRSPPNFRSGKGWDHADTNCPPAGMLIEKVTGHTCGDEIRRRDLAPLGLSATCVPGDDSVIPGPHPRGSYGRVAGTGAAPGRVRSPAVAPVSAVSAAPPSSPGAPLTVRRAFRDRRATPPRS